MAKTQGDREAVRKIREDIREFNQSLPAEYKEDAIDGKALKKSLSGFLTTTGKMVNGIVYTDAMRKKAPAEAGASIQVENNIHRRTSYQYCYTVRHVRKPNLPFSMQVCVSNFHSLRFATLFSCSLPFSVLTQGTNMDAPTLMSSQSTVIRNPSGFRSSTFNTF
jgi:hypothetical protein